jgi:hypothetical protein
MQNLFVLQVTYKKRNWRQLFASLRPLPLLGFKQICTFWISESDHIHTVIRFVSTSAKWGTCTVVSVSGTQVKIKCLGSTVNVRILASTSVPFTPTTVQVPNLTITVQSTKALQYMVLHPPPPFHTHCRPIQRGEEGGAECWSGGNAAEHILE